MQYWVMAAVVTAASLLGACKHELTGELYVSDIQALAATPGNAGVAVGRLRAEVPAKQTCEEQGAEIIKTLSSAFKNIRDVRCETAGINAYMTAAVDIPVLSLASAKNVTTPDGSALAIAIASKEDKTIAVVALVGTETLQKLRAQLKRRFLQDLPVEDIRLKLVVNNDGKGEAAVIAQSAFVNGVPAPFGEDFTVARREKLEILLSDVATAHAVQSGSMLVFALPPAGET